MPSKLNVKLVAMVLAGLLVFGVSAHFLHAFQLRQNAYRLLQRGDKAALDKDYDKALRFYAQYLIFQPGNVDTLQKYAEALDVRATDVGERVELVLKMEQVLRAKPNQQALRMRLVHNLIFLDRVGEAIDNLRKLQDSWADKAEILHMLGWCYDAVKNYPQAARCFEDAIRINLKQIRSYALLAEVQQDRLNDPDAAQKTMDDLVQANPDAYRAFLLRGRFLRQRGDEKAAVRDLEAAHRLGPNQAEVLLEIADSARARGNWEEASRLLKDGMKRFPDNADFVKQIVSVEILAGKPETAIENLRAGIKSSPRSNELAILLIDLLIDRKQYAEARAKIDELIKAGLKPTLPNYLKARLLIGAQDYRAALKLLEEVRQDLGPTSEWSGRVNVLLGYCYRQIGEHEQELQAFHRAVRDEPTWASAGIGLGSALWSNGRLEEALQTLEPMRTTAELPAGYWILLSRARLARQLGKPAQERRWDDVEEALTKAAAEPSNMESPILWAEMLAARNDLDAAQAVLDKAHAEHPQAIPLWCALADLEMRRKRFDRAEQILDRATREQGDHLELRLARCRLWSAAGDLSKLALLDQALPAGFTLEQRALLRRELAQTWTRLGQSERAENAWRTVADDLPKDTRSRFALLELALQKNQRDAARRWRDALRAIEGPDGWLWRYADAAILVQEAHGQHGSLEQARKKLEEIDLVRKDWPKAALLAAAIFELQGQYPAAIEQYSRVVESGDVPAASMARLLELLIRRREFSKAETELTRYEQKQPLSRDIARLGADIAIGMRDQRYAALAVRRAEQAVVMPMRDYRDAVWLAHIYQAAGDRAKAENLLRDCLEHDGQAPDVWVAWMEFLMTTNQGSKAAAEIDKMKRVVPMARQPLTLARCYEALRQSALADKAYRAALAAAPDDVATLARAADFFRWADRAELAENSYRRLVEPALLAPAEYAILARRHLAVLLAPRDRTQALAVLEQHKPSQGESVGDQRSALVHPELDRVGPPRCDRPFRGIAAPATADPRRASAAGADARIGRQSRRRAGPVGRGGGRSAV